jgi:hypothetical protein
MTDEIFPLLSAPHAAKTAASQWDNIRARGITAIFIAIIIVLATLVIVVLMRAAQGRDLGQWTDVGEQISYWYAHLMRPDAPGSCCGEADAYWADEVNISDGQVWAVVTDDRPDAPLERPHVPRGAMVYVPPEKMKSDKGNPTGHVVIFLGSQWDGTNFHNFEAVCYVTNTGT